MRDTRPIAVRLREAAELAVPERTRENLCMEASGVIRELVATCEQAEYWLNEQAEGGEIVQPDEMLRVLRAAIAKAKGGQLAQLRRETPGAIGFNPADDDMGDAS